jgi:hypothetical protein
MIALIPLVTYDVLANVSHFRSQTRSTANSQIDLSYLALFDATISCILFQKQIDEQQSSENSIACLSWMLRHTGVQCRKSTHIVDPSRRAKLDLFALLQFRQYKSH